MGAKVLKMDGVTTVTKAPNRNFSYYSEDPKAQRAKSIGTWGDRGIERGG